MYMRIVISVLYRPFVAKQSYMPLLLKYFMSELEIVLAEIK